MRYKSSTKYTHIIHLILYFSSSFQENNLNIYTFTLALLRAFISYATGPTKHIYELRDNKFVCKNYRGSKAFKMM